MLRFFTPYLFLLSLIFISCSPRKEESVAKRPNIVFIFSDDHAYQAISAYNDRLASLAPTPNIDRIAAEGIRFDKCYVTNSICAPSRATVLTGKHSHANGHRTNGDTFDGSQVTFPKLLQAQGYETALVGKWHLKSAPTGFDYWDILPGQGHYYNPDFITPTDTFAVEGYVTDLITDKALNWLQNNRDQDKPFVLMVQHKAPHRAWEKGPKHLSLYEDVEFPEPENLFDDYSGRGAAAKTQDMTIERTMKMESDLKMRTKEQGASWTRTYGRMNEAQRAAWDAVYDPIREDFEKLNPQGKDLVRWKYQRYMRDYLTTIRSVDENIGRVLAYLDESGLAENTLVVYCSDQGFYLGEHGWFDKRFMYEESFRTPLVMRWPGVIKPGSVNNDLVSNLDFAQTFVQMAGGEAPKEMQGLSLLPLMQGTTPADWRESLYYHYYEFPGPHSVRKHEGVANKRYKLLHFYELDEWEFYDLEKDPNEMNSGYNNPDYAKTIDQMKAELARLKQEYKVQ